MKNWVRFSSIALTAMLALGTGCPEDNNATTTQDMGTTTADMSPTTMTDDGSTDSGGEMTGIPSAYEARYEMRFDTLKFTDQTLPDKASLVRILNGLLKDNLDQSVENPIVILLDIKDIDASAMTMKLRSGAGIKTVNEGEYEWHPMTPPGFVDGTLDAASAEVSGEIPTFVFIATIGDGADAMSVPLIINGIKFKSTLENADEAGLAQIKAGTPEYALYGFALYYASCLGVNWWFYARKNAEIKC